MAGQLKVLAQVGYVVGKKEFDVEFVRHSSTVNSGLSPTSRAVELGVDKDAKLLYVGFATARAVAEGRVPKEWIAEAEGCEPLIRSYRLTGVKDEEVDETGPDSQVGPGSDSEESGSEDRAKLKEDKKKDKKSKVVKIVKEKKGKREREKKKEKAKKPRSPNPPAPSAPALTQYELDTAARIARNNEVMRKLRDPDAVLDPKALFPTQPLLPRGKGKALPAVVDEDSDEESDDGEGDNVEGDGGGGGAGNKSASSSSEDSEEARQDKNKNAKEPQRTPPTGPSKKPAQSGSPSPAEAAKLRNRKRARKP